MAYDYVVQSTTNDAIKEDVLGIVEILTATESWFLNNFGKTVAINPIHTVLTDTLRTAASAAVGEQDDFVPLTRTQPSRVINYVEKIAIPFKVSRTEQLVQHYYGEDELARQTTKALTEWGSAAEFDLVRSTLASGPSGTAQTMSGILEAISHASTVVDNGTGVVLAASHISGMMKGNMEVSNGDVATDLFVGSYLRNAIDLFTQKSNTIVSVDATTIQNTVDIYSTSFGRLAIHYHRYLQQSGDGDGRVLAVRPEKFKIAYLRRPYVDTSLQRAGDYDFRAVVGDLTLECRNKYSNWLATGFDDGVID